MKNISKEIVRSEVVGLLKSLDKGWLESAGNQLCINLNKLISSHFAHVKAILAWASFFPGEPELAGFIAQQQESRKVYLPRSLADFTLDFVLAGKDWQTKMKPGIHGIPEPVANPNASYSVIASGESVILVPGLAFDRSGNRLGRGKGYYDRFLSKPENENIKKIGVGWSMQVIEHVQSKPHDIPVNWLCTENEIIKI